MLKFLKKLWNDDRAFWQLAASLGGQALSGWLGGRKKQEETFDRTENLNRTTNSSSSPVFNTEALPLAGASLNSAMGQLNAPINFDTTALDNLQLQQSGGVNSAFEGAGNNLAASLAARGLTNSPGVQTVANANLQGARAGQLGQIAAGIAQQKFNIPLMQEEIRRNRLQSALATLGLFRGQTGTETTTGTSRTTGTGATTGADGGGWRGLLGGFAEGIAFNAGNKDDEDKGLGNV